MRDADGGRARGVRRSNVRARERDAHTQAPRGFRSFFHPQSKLSKQRGLRRATAAHGINARAQIVRHTLAHNGVVAVVWVLGDKLPDPRRICQECARGPLRHQR